MDTITQVRNYFKAGWAKNGQLGGYVHDTNMCQYIPPNTFYPGTVGTATYVAGQVAGMFVQHFAAAAETIVPLIPIQIPSNYIALKGCLLKYVEVDYQVLIAACTSVTLAMVKVTRGLDTAVAVVSAPAGAQLLLPATTAATVDKHRDRFTLTTPAYISSEEYYFLKVTAVKATTTQMDFLGGFAYFTERL